MNKVHRAGLLSFIRRLSSSGSSSQFAISNTQTSTKHGLLQLGACHVSAVWNQKSPLVGGFLYTLALEVVLWWEGPL